MTNNVHNFKELRQMFEAITFYDAAVQSIHTVVNAFLISNICQILD